MSIGIVTAFFDIGRGDWSVDKGHPHYLKRTNETYLERFSHLAKLENEIVIFTSYEFVDTIAELRKGKVTKIIPFDYEKEFAETLNNISVIQNSESFKSCINPSQIMNPEYWNNKYVLINALKSFFVRIAIEKGLITSETVAWLDFGYCRDENTLNGITEWKYNFDADKIHMFNVKDCDSLGKEKNIVEIIANNDVHITGPCIVANRKMWPTLETYVSNALVHLMKNGFVDDDQTLLLMSYLSHKDIFELHPVSNQDWFVVFKDFNNE